MTANDPRFQREAMTVYGLSFKARYLSATMSIPTHLRFNVTPSKIPDIARLAFAPAEPPLFLSTYK